jgi:hypothetical protein
MGHIGEKGLHALHSKYMFECIPNCSLDLDFCEHCVYGKQNRVIFPYGGKRAKRIME